ncbi:MAG TPA: extracellular solute-binding protein, partial [Chloroflexota bacterium]
MPHSRREFLRLTLAALAGATAASLAAACGPGSQPSGGAAPAGAPTTAAAGAPAAASVAEPTATPFAVAAFGSSSAKVAIRYWTILGSVDGIVMNDLVRKFSEANPDIRIESLQGVTDFITKMETAAISGTAPDVALVRHTYIGPFADKKVLTPLTQAELDQVGIAANNFDPTVWKFSQYQGQQYTIPLDIHCHAMLYNKALFAGGGVQPPTTLDEWSNAVAKLTSGDVIGYNTFGIGNGASEVLCWYWYGIHQQFGGEMLTPDASKAAFNSPEGIAAVTWMRDMQQKGNPKGVPSGDLQRTGKVASWADGPWISTLYFDKTKAAAADD